jgi:hypothetical protein
MRVEGRLGQDAVCARRARIKVAHGWMPRRKYMQQSAAAAAAVYTRRLTCAR